jgi:hypothetical protein
MTPIFCSLAAVIVAVQPTGDVDHASAPPPLPVRFFEGSPPDGRGAGKVTERDLR